MSRIMTYVPYCIGKKQTELFEERCQHHALCYLTSQLSGERVPLHAGGMAIPYRSLNPLCRNASSHTAPMQLEKLSAPHLNNSPQVSTVLPGFLPKATVKFSWSYGKNRVGESMLNTEQCALSLHLWYSCPLSPA